MNPHENPKLNQRQKEQAAIRQDAGQTAQSAIAEFKSPEEMLRFDASQTEVPPTLAERVQESVRKEPPPRNWWQRLFGNS